MANQKIHEYPIERFTFGDDDYYDIDFWDGSGYQTAKIKGSTIKNAMFSGLSSINTLTAENQLLAVGTSGTDFAINSSTNTHTFNLPTASAVKRGALSQADWTVFNAKQNPITLTTTGSGVATFILDTLNIPTPPSPSNYSITSSNQIETTSNTDVVATGLEVTPPAGTYKVDFNGHYMSIPGNVVAIATLDLQVLKLYLNNLTATGTHGLSFGSGETLTAGVYDVAGAMSIAGVLTLSGGANDIFVFRSAGAINTASFTTVQLTGGVKSANVFFLANGALGLGANNVLSGNFIAVGAAAALGADATFNGRLLSTAGSIAFGAGTISKPTDVSLVPLGILESFLGFTNGGGIQNTALAVITGNLGTGSATVVIFVGSVFNGVAFDVTQPFGDTNVFSLYKGNTLIPFTERYRYYNTYVEDVALSSIVTVNGTESISVRWRTDIGKVILTNRILTIVQII
jgi:hypothetical protein